MKPFLCAVVIAGCLVGCRGGSDGEVVVLDLGGAIDNPRIFDLGEIARSVEFIPLDGSVPVGEIANWHGLQPAADGGFYIADAESMSPVQHFDSGGRFVGTVGRIGRGPGEVAFIAGISVNNATGDIYVDGTTEVLALDAAGNEFARAGGFFSWGMMWYGDRLLTLPVSPPWEEDVYARDTIPFIDMFDRDLNPIGNLYGPNVGPGVTMRGMSFPPVWSDNGERLLVKQGGRGDTLYHYHPSGTISPAYFLKMGSHMPPAELFAQEPAGELTDHHYLVAGVWEGERWMIVSTVNDPFGETSTTSYLLFDRRDMTAEGFSAQGPGREPGLFIDGVKFTPGYVRGNWLVGYMNAFEIVDNATKIARPDLKKIAEELREESNPVIVVMEL